MHVQNAVHCGNLEEVIKIVNSVGISHFEEYCLICDALKRKHTEIAKFILSKITTVNNKSRKRTNTPLHIAVKNGDVELVQMLLDKGAEVDAKNEHGRTSLHIAIECMELDISELLLDQLANVNARDRNGTTPLSIAAETGCLDIVKELIIRGASVDTAYSYYFRECGVINKLSGVTPLHISVQKEHYQIVEHLLKHEANVNSEITSIFKKHYTPLHLAIEKNNEEVIKLLIKHGADIQAEGRCSITPLHIAAEKGYENIVELLTENGANIDAQDMDGKTILYFAVLKGYHATVKTILKCFPDIGNKSNQNSLVAAVCGCGKEYKNIAESLFEYGFTIIPEEVNFELLQALVEKGYLKILEDIFNYNSNIIIQYNLKNNGSTLLHIAAQNKQEQMAKLLISQQVDVDACDETGKTAIFYAVANGDIQMFKLLVTRANVDVTDINGMTLLHFSAKGGYELICKMLLNRGTNVNAEQAQGQTALHIATYEGHEKVVKLLLKYGAQVNFKDKTQNTPLHISLAKAKLNILETLLSYGADVDSTDASGRTALHIACGGHNKELVRTLLKYGPDMNVTDQNNRTPLSLTKMLYLQQHLACPFEYPFYTVVHLHKEIMDILEKYIIKMNIANLYVSKKNLKSISMKSTLSKFKIDCEKEMEFLSSEKISYNISYQKILTKDIKALTKYARNEGIVQVLKSNDCKIKFPIYCCLITSNMRKGIIRKMLLDDAIKYFYALFRGFPSLPYDCVEKLICYFSDNELRILTSACV